MTSSSASARAASPVLADLLPGALTRDVVLTAVYALAIAASAQVAFPLPGTPVPVTGETFAVLLGAAALGTRRAAVGGGLFLALGVAGVPWFAATSGATLGYIVGFVVAAAVVGSLAQRGWLASWRRAAISMLAGNVAIWTFGVAGLMLVTGLTLRAAIVAGVLPFLAGDAVKLAAATALLPGVQRLVDRA